MNIEDVLTKKVGGIEKSYSEIALDSKRGREYLNSMYPREFEYYACAFELVDENGERLDFFSFPVIPTSIQETRPSLANIKKTFGGIVITNQSTFVPFDISISGNFGRKMRRVIHDSYTQSKSVGEPKIQKTTNADGTVTEEKVQEMSEVVITNVFSTDYKTGFGSTKILEEIFLRAQGTDINNKPLRLFFYNLSLSSNYLVEPVNISFSQARDQNMIWQYSMQLKAVAPAKYIFSQYKSSLKQLRSYNKKYVRMTEKANIVNELLKNVISGMTPVESVMNQFQNYKGLGKQSAFKLIKNLTDNPLESIDIIKNKY